MNIEGLAEWKGGGLLIGFRNPLQDGGKAPVVPLENPRAVVLGKEPAKFGKPILLDLEGRGIRSIDRVEDGYVIVAGPVADVGHFGLYRWTGKEGDAPALSSQAVHSRLSPEAAIAIQGTRQILLLSDDGALSQGVACGDPAKAAQRFRALRVTLP